MNEQFDIYLDNTICDIIKDSGGFQTRHKSMIKMITNSWNKIIKDKLKDNEKIELSVFTGDNYGKSDIGLSVAMAGEKKDYDNLVPAFVFENWAEAGIHDYTEKIKQISDAGLKKYEFDKVFWRGNVSTHHTRKKLIEYGLKHKSTTDFDFIKNKVFNLNDQGDIPGRFNKYLYLQKSLFGTYPCLSFNNTSNGLLVFSDNHFLILKFVFFNAIF